MTNFWLVLSVVKSFFKWVPKLINWIRNFFETKKQREEDERELRRNDALKDFKNAENEKEAMDAQKRIVKNKP